MVDWSRWTERLVLSTTAFFAGVSSSNKVVTVSVPIHMQAKLREISVRLPSGEIRSLDLLNWWVKVLSSRNVTYPYGKGVAVVVGFENMPQKEADNWADLIVDLEYCEAEDGHWHTGQKWWMFINGSGTMKMDVYYRDILIARYLGESVLEPPETDFSGSLVAVKGAINP